MTNIIYILRDYFNRYIYTKPPKCVVFSCTYGLCDIFLCFLCFNPIKYDVTKVTSYVQSEFSGS